MLCFNGRFVFISFLLNEFFCCIEGFKVALQILLGSDWSEIYHIWIFFQCVFFWGL